MTRENHPLFIRYQRGYLHEVTGYSLAYLSDLAAGKTPLTRAFIKRVCTSLQQPEDKLFHVKPIPTIPTTVPPSPHLPLARWLAERCQEEGLSLRQAGVRTGLSPSAIADVINGASVPSPNTIKKLAEGFGGDAALQDHLLLLAGHREARPKEPSPALAELIDKVSEFDERRVRMMARFADFLAEE